MYQLILLKDGLLQICNFKSQAEAYSYVSLAAPNKYKIYPPNKNRKLNLVNSYYWDESKQDFVINISIAKEIKKNLFREIRSILFEKLDKAFLKALEQDDTERKNYIVSLKNQFRDITDLDLPDTEEELINFIPAVFKEVYDLVI
jgi:hypothetical protein